MKKEEGMDLAKRFKTRLLELDLPVKDVILHGSVAKEETHEWSDVDIAVICVPFRPTRHDENVELMRARRDIDLRIEPFALHPDDFNNRYWGFPSEVMKNGISV